jgi:hypothetical protein
MWRLKGGRHVVPTEEDLEAALDEAARVLYDEAYGASVTVGRLIIVKQPTNHDVYVYVGTYE